MSPPLEHVFRDEWGRVLATLIGLLGDFDLAEEAAQEEARAALARALELASPWAVFLDGPPTADAHDFSNAVLRFRPGLLFVASPPAAAG